MREIIIKCKGSRELPLKKILPLQKKLKKFESYNRVRLRNSIIELGFSFPFFIWSTCEGKPKDKMELMDGVHRLKVLGDLEKEGFKLPEGFPVVDIDAKDYDEAKKKLLAVTSAFAEITPKGLDEFLNDVNFDLKYVDEKFNLIGVDIPDMIETKKEVEDLFNSVDEEDKLPEVKDVFVKEGDLFLLDEHKILCGNCFDADLINTFLGGESYSLLTDPPYGINYDNNVQFINDLKNTYKKFSKNYKKNILQGGHDKKKIANDDSPFDLNKVLYLIDKSKFTLLFGADYFTDSKLDLKKGTFQVWDKKGNTMKDFDYSDFELFWISEKKKKSIHTFIYLGYSGSEGKRVHPTQKPVKLFNHLIETFFREQKIILDPFLGSGTTLLACEKTHKVCYGVELDPEYIQAAIERWQELTGKNAYHVESHKTYNELKENFKGLE